MILRRTLGTGRVRSMIAFSAFIMLLFVIIILYQAFTEYDKTTKQGKQKAEWLTNILSDQIEMSFLTVDLALQRAVERQYLNTLFGGTLPDDLIHNFNVWIEEAPQLVALMLINEKGEVELSVNDKDYKNWTDYSQSMENAEPFITLRDNPDLAAYVGPHFDKTSPHKDVILIAKRVNKLNGGFGGIVVAAVYSNFFLDFFQSVDTGTNRSMSLLLDDGRNLFKNTLHPRVNHALTEKIKPALLAYGKKSGATGSFFKRIDGSVNVISYKHFKSLPMILSVTINEKDFLKGFWDDRFKDISFLAIFTIFGSVLSFFALAMAKQIVHIEESESAAILASQAKSEFLANMSHELRTPLNAIIGFSEMMNSGYFGPLNAKQKERMYDINLCGTHLLHLINDILEFSKGDAGKLELIEEDVNVTDTIREVVRMINDKIRLKEIVVTLDVEPHLPMLLADARKIKQILLNLISNATKFTPEHGHIRVSAHMDASGAMHLVVSDTGIGIAEEDIPKALSVFGQVHRSRNHEGTGLGLPLCRMFTELHGGKLTLTSTVGEGTTVRCVFPASRVLYESSNDDN
jgi:signal transduction histidine kinase